jgi:septum formation protein
MDERLLPGESAEAHVARLANAKAEWARQAYPRALVIAGDTVVVLEGEVLGKPRDRTEGEAMLRRLSGRTHGVLSAYRLLDGESGRSLGRTVETRVTFRELPDAWIAWYAGLPEMQDKAGAYAIQGIGGAMIARIEGSYTNVVGFPIEFIVWDLIEQGWVRL